MPNGKLYRHEKYDEIVQEQTHISYYAKGISIDDTDEMCPYDRKLVLKTIVEIREREIKASESSSGMLSNG